MEEVRPASITVEEVSVEDLLIAETPRRRAPYDRRTGQLILPSGGGVRPRRRGEEEVVLAEEEEMRLRLEEPGEDNEEAEAFSPLPHGFHLASAASPAFTLASTPVLSPTSCPSPALTPLLGGGGEVGDPVLPGCSDWEAWQVQEVGRLQREQERREGFDLGNIPAPVGLGGGEVLEDQEHLPTPDLSPVSRLRRLPIWQQRQLDVALARVQERQREREGADSSALPSVPVSSVAARRRGEGEGDRGREDVEEEEEHPPGPVRLAPRVVRGLAGGEQMELADRLDPEVPDRLTGQSEMDPEGWHMVDQLSVWDCSLCLFYTMERVPSALKEKWGKVVARVLREVLRATSPLALCRALKMFLLLPQAFLRQAKRGGQVGRSSVAARFNSACGGDWGRVIAHLLVDRERKEERRGQGQRVTRQDETRDKEKRRKFALTNLSHGRVGKTVSRIISTGMADISDPVVMAELREKYPARRRALPATVSKGHCVDSLSCLRESLLGLPTGVSPGSGGLRGEFLTALAEVWEDEEMELLEHFSLLYLNGECGDLEMPKWWYRVWGSVTTVPLWKTLGKVGIRPVGVPNPLRRTLHRCVIQQNHGPLTTFLEPQQLALSRAGGHKLVHSVRMGLEAYRDWVVVKLDMKKAHNEISRAANRSAHPTEGGGEGL